MGIKKEKDKRINEAKTSKDNFDLRYNIEGNIKN